MRDTYQTASKADTDRYEQKQRGAVLRIDIAPAGLGQRGLRYRLTYASRVLIESSRNPEFDACRALLALGLTGRLQVWRSGKTSHDIQLDIERGAGRTVLENEQEGPRFVRWRPFRRGDAEEPFLSDGANPPAAEASSFCTRAGAGFRRCAYQIRGKRGDASLIN